MIEITKEEKRAIAALKKLAKNWPPSLWLFVTGDINVMKTDANGNRVYFGDDVAFREYNRNCGVDQSYRVASISFPCDGGDW